MLVLLFAAPLWLVWDGRASLLRNTTGSVVILDFPPRAQQQWAFCCSPMTFLSPTTMGNLLGTPLHHCVCDMFPSAFLVAGTILFMGQVMEP